MKTCNSGAQRFLHVIRDWRTGQLSFDEINFKPRQYPTLRKLSPVCGMASKYMVRAGRLGIRLVIFACCRSLIEQFLWNIPAILSDFF